MNFKTTIALVILLVIVAGVSFYVHHSQKDEEAGKQSSSTTDSSNESGKPLLDIKYDDVKTITIRPANGEAMTLTRESGQWRFTAPFKGLAKSPEVSRLVGHLVATQSRGTVTESEAAGLRPPRFAITITTNRGRTLELNIGDRNAIHDAMYVQRPGSPPIVATPEAWDSLHKELSDLRDRTMVQLQKDQVAEVTVQREGAPKITLKKVSGAGSDAHWRETAPMSLPAENSEVNKVIDAVTGVQVDSYVKAKSVAPDVTGLEKPRVMVTLGTTPASASPPATTPAAPDKFTTVRFGEPDAFGSSNIYASVSEPNSTELVKVGKSSLDSFKQTPIDFRDKDLLDIEPQLVSSFTIAIHRPATTQPTTKPAENREFTIKGELVKVAPPAFGPAPLPSTEPASAPATTPATPATPPPCDPAPPATSKAPAVPATKPAPPATLPVAPATKPAAPAPAPAAFTTKWTWKFVAGGKGDAEEGQVNALLAKLHKFRVEKFIEPGTFKGATYKLTVHKVAANAADVSKDVVITLTDTGTRVVGQYEDATFEVSRDLIDVLSGDFKTPKPPAPAPVRPPPGHNPFGRGGPLGEQP